MISQIIFLPVNFPSKLDDLILFAGVYFAGGWDSYIIGVLPFVLPLDWWSLIRTLAGALVVIDHWSPVAAYASTPILCSVSSWDLQPRWSCHLLLAWSHHLCIDGHTVIYKLPSLHEFITTFRLNQFWKPHIRRAYQLSPFVFSPLPFVLAIVELLTFFSLSMLS